MAGATATVIAARSNAAVRTRIMRFMRTTSFLSRFPADRLYLRDDTRREGTSEHRLKRFKTGFRVI
jgi:hypothetical protein